MRSLYEKRRFPSRAWEWKFKYHLHCEHGLYCLPEHPIGRHTWCADIHEHAPIVRDVEQLAGEHITLTNREETKGSYSQQGPKEGRNPVEPMFIPDPGDQGRAKASCWIEAGTRDGCFQPHHHRHQNPYHKRSPTHETMATHKKKNGEYEQKSQAHLCQEYNPEGISCSGYCCSIPYTGSMFSPDKHHQQRTYDRTEQLARNVPSQVKMMHLPLQPERQRNGRIDMTTTELPKG